jgi:hypothetical protein
MRIMRWWGLASLVTTWVGVVGHQPDEQPELPPIELRRVELKDSPFSMELSGEEDDSMDLISERRLGDGMVEGFWRYDSPRVPATLIRLKLDADTTDKDAIFDFFRSFVIENSSDGETDIQDFQKARTPEIQKLPTLRMTYFTGREKGERVYTRFVAVRKDFDVFAFWCSANESDHEAMETVKRMENSILVKM